MAENDGLILSENKDPGPVFDNIGALAALLEGTDAGKLSALPYGEDVFLQGTEIAGTNHVENMRELYAKLEPGERVALFRETENEFDSRAIIVKTADGEKLGYVPMRMNLMPSRLMDAGYELYALVRKMECGTGWHRIVIKIYLHLPGNEYPGEGLMTDDWTKDPLPEEKPPATGSAGEYTGSTYSAWQTQPAGWPELLKEGKKAYYGGGSSGMAAQLLWSGIMHLPGEMLLELAAQLYAGVTLGGAGIEKDYEQALFWANRAVINGDTGGLYIEGFIRCEGGYGAEEDSRLAARAFKRGAELGNPDCMYAYASVLQLGIGTEMNEELAEKWLRRAAGKERRVNALLERLEGLKERAGSRYSG